MTEKSFEEKLREDNAFLEKIFNTNYFENRPDRQLAYLVGRYYSKATYLQQRELKTNSLIKKLPNFTKRLDLQKINSMMNECNLVLQKIASMKKTSNVMLADLRNRIFDLMQAIEEITSDHNELGIAFQMGYDSSLAQLRTEEEENKK